MQELQYPYIELTKAELNPGWSRGSGGRPIGPMNTACDKTVLKISPHFTNMQRTFV